MKQEFKPCILTVEAMGAIIYCEKTVGQYKKECEEISMYNYMKYEEWAKEGKSWGYQLISDKNFNFIYVVCLPPCDNKSIVQLCSGLAARIVSDVQFTNNNYIPMVIRVAGIIYESLKQNVVTVED